MPVLIACLITMLFLSSVMTNVILFLFLWLSTQNLQSKPLDSFQQLREKLKTSLPSVKSNKEEYSPEDLELREAFEEANAREGGMSEEEKFWFNAKRPDWVL